MVITKSYAIDKWTKWSDAVYEAGYHFYEENDVYPNVLIMNSHTDSQINYLVNIMPGEKKFVHDSLGEDSVPVDENMEVQIEFFKTSHFTLTCAISEDMPDKIFDLMYDPDPFWNMEDDDDDSNGDDDNPVPVPDPEGYGVFTF